VKRRKYVTFAKAVKMLGKPRDGYIDAFWKGVLVVEHKSEGKNLNKAEDQAFDYLSGLKQEELPRYVITSDFTHFRVKDLDEDKVYIFSLKDLDKYVDLLSFISGYTKTKQIEEDPVNIKAAELMGELHDNLRKGGYDGHELELLLVRLLFCLFADDSKIFEESGVFKRFIIEKTREDGSDLGLMLANVFQALNTPKNERSKNLDEEFNLLTYINGQLFNEKLSLAFFDSDMRRALIKCSDFDWSRISPAIFGSLYQHVMDPAKRDNIKAHYTSEGNIMKLIKPLFLDDLYNEFRRTKGNKRDLVKFHEKLAKLKFLDPACGCGNFLVISYRELRLLEMEVLKVLIKQPNKQFQQELDISIITKIDVDCMYGIEIEESSSKIAEVALWLMDHQMNRKISSEFGQSIIRIPLKKSATILQSNALRIDWKKIIEPENLSYILGNPPFAGSKLLSTEQSQDMSLIFNDVNGAGILDYVTAWYIKAANYIQGTNIKASFVSTNSISQGEQVGVLWNELFSKYKVKIHFAHRTFAWDNEARGKAHVHVVILGFGIYDTPIKRLFDYEDIKGEPHEAKVKNINPYLLEGNDMVIVARSKPICNVKKMNFGNMPLDGNNLILSDEEKEEILRKEPRSSEFIRPFIGAKEFLNAGKRWCLWLVDINPSELREMPLVLERIQRVREFREQSKASTTRKIANTPTLFRDRNNPASFIVVPRVSSERRKYVPMGFFGKEYIAGDTCMIIADATIYDFGILTSEMHMIWMKYVCGRLKSDYRYSKDIVYNNFSWPENPSESQIKSVKEKAKDILEVRKEFTGNSLADLYDPNTMPPELVKAHSALDKAVDKCYGKQAFQSERSRIEYLFTLYNKYIQPLINVKKTERNKYC
ncbi:class I SAM-dependent DNA methyltransferase, partial [Elusimicrobiota bacterium]